MNDRYPYKISVIDPVSEAISRMKMILFEPFDLAKWFTIGFCAWLANLCQGGGGGAGGGGNNASGENFSRIPEFFAAHQAIIIIVSSIVLVLVLALILVCLWLSSRGKFMFLYCVVENKAEIKVPWHKFREHGNSLFLFRLVAGIILFICIAIIAGAIAIPIIMLVREGNSFGAFIIAIIVVAGLVGITLFIFFGLIFKFTKDFVVPIMYLRDIRCIDAWREFLTLLTSYKLNFALYILFQILLTIVIGTIVITAVCITCCIAGCLMALPYLGAVLLLPMTTFCLSYCLYYLRQYGPDFDVFTYQEEVIPPEFGQ